MHKQDLVSQLNNAQNNFMLGIAALGLLMQKESFPILNNLVCVITETSFSFVSDPSQIRNKFQDVQFPIKVAPFSLGEAANYIKTSNNEHLQTIQKEFFAMLLRALLKESFEVIKNYCIDSGQLDLFKKQDWYHFARVIRNCLSHNFLVEYKNNDKKLLPISWRGKSFTSEMHGKPLETSFLSIDYALELSKEMREFVDKSL